MKQNIEAKIIRAVARAIDELRNNEKYKSIKDISKLKIIKSISTQNAGVRSHWLNERQLLFVVEIEKDKISRIKKGTPKVEENRKKKAIYKKYKGLPKDIVDEHFL